MCVCVCVCVCLVVCVRESVDILLRFSRNATENVDVLLLFARNIFPPAKRRLAVAECGRIFFLCLQVCLCLLASLVYPSMSLPGVTCS